MSKSLSTVLAGLALLACLAPAAALPAPELPTESAIQGQTLALPGDLVVANGTTLRIEGSTLLIGGKVDVQPGGRLEMAPWNGQPSRLMPLNATTGFWITVDGTFVTGGLPRSQITGLNGHGLDSVLLTPGGLRVNGTAVLHDVDIANGTAGIIVASKGTLEMQDASFRNLFLMGLAVMGRADLQRVQASDNIIGVTANAAGGRCSVTIANSTLQSMAANFQMVGCTTTITDSDLDGSSNNVATGAFDLTMRNTRVTGYALTGLRSEGATRIRLDNVHFKGGAEAEHGIESMPKGHLALDHVTIERNGKSGIELQASTLEIANSTVRLNGGPGIRVTRGPYPLDLSSVDFGVSKGAENRGGAIQYLEQFVATLADAQGQPVHAFTMKVFRPDSPDPVFTGSEGVGGLVASYTAYSLGPNGNAHYDGPFTYQVTWPGGERTLEGRVPQGATSVSLHTTDRNPGDAVASEPGASPWLGAPRLALLAGAGAIGVLVLGSLWVRRRRAQAATEDAAPESDVQ